MGNFQIGRKCQVLRERERERASWKLDKSVNI